MERLTRRYEDKRCLGLSFSYPKKDTNVYLCTRPLLLDPDDRSGPFTVYKTAPIQCFSTCQPSLISKIEPVDFTGFRPLNGTA